MIPNSWWLKLPCGTTPGHTMSSSDSRSWPSFRLKPTNTDSHNLKLLGEIYSIDIFCVRWFCWVRKAFLTVQFLHLKVFERELGQYWDCTIWTRFDFCLWYKQLMTRSIHASMSVSWVIFSCICQLRVMEFTWYLCRLKCVSLQLTKNKVGFNYKVPFSRMMGLKFGEERG